MTDRQRLRKAFKKLRSMGYEATLKGKEPVTENYVQLNSELTKIFDQNDKAIKPVPLKWGGDGDDILSILHSCDVGAEWIGDKTFCIYIF